MFLFPFLCLCDGYCFVAQLAEEPIVMRLEYLREEEQTVKDLQAEITSLSADRDTLDQNIQDLTTDISDYEEEVPDADRLCLLCSGPQTSGICALQ